MKPSHILAFLLLCLSASAGWIWSEVLPARMGTLAGQGLHLLLIGLALTAFRRQALPTNLIRITLAGLALFAAPLLLLHAAHTLVSSSFGVLIFALLPIAVMLMTGNLKPLIPALIGVAGILLLLPVSLPEGRGLLGLPLMTAAMALTAAALVWLHRLQASWSAAPLICLANGIVLILAGWTDASWSLVALRTESLRALLIEAPEVLLLLWLIPNLEPRRLSVRWLLAPLFTILEGYVLMRPPIDARLLTGVALLALSAWAVFRGNHEEETPGLHL